MYEISVITMEERIKQLEQIQKEAHRYEHKLPEFRNGQVFKAYKIPVDIPLYNLENGRTKANQEEYVKKNNKTDDFFKDVEAQEAQEAQHKILEELIDIDKALKKDLVNKDGDLDTPVILDYSGYIINGNRRVCLIRTEKLNDYIDVIILPKSTTKEEKRQLEFNLQIKQPTKMNYSWVNEAMMLKKEIHNKSAIDELLKQNVYNKKSDIYLYIDALSHGEKYLKKRGIEKEYSKIEKHQQAFKELAKWYKKLNSDLEKGDFFRDCAFDIISSKEKTEIDYRLIKSTHKWFDSIYDGKEEIKVENDSETRVEVIRDLIKTAEEKEEEKHKKEYPIICLKKAIKYIEEANNSLNKSNFNNANHIIKNIEILISDIKSKICQD